MGKKTEIPWCDHTWNPFQGCHKCSPGCANCYMFRDKIRYGQVPDEVVRSKDPTFNLPNKLKGPALVFVCSWSDFFIEEADEWRDEAWKIINDNPKLTFLILTKRPENIASRLPDGFGVTTGDNVYIGVTVENQEMADKRIPLLLEVPAPKLFISIEPMLGPVDLSDYIGELDYVIVGGESGPVEDVREMEEIWALDVIELCEASGTKIMFKQWSAPKEGNTIGGNKYLDRLEMV